MTPARAPVASAASTTSIVRLHVPHLYSVVTVLNSAALKPSQLAKEDTLKVPVHLLVQAWPVLFTVVHAVLVLQPGWLQVNCRCAPVTRCPAQAALRQSSPTPEPPAEVSSISS